MCDLGHKEFQKGCAFCRIAKLEEILEDFQSYKDEIKSVGRAPRDERTSLKRVLWRLRDLEACRNWNVAQIDSLKDKLYKPYFNEEYKVSFWQRLGFIIKNYFKNRKAKKLRKQQEKECACGYVECEQKLPERVDCGIFGEVDNEYFE